MTRWLKQHVRFWVRTFWGTILIAVIALAVVVQLGRAIFPIMHEYRDVVEQALSDQLGVDIAIGAIEGEWQGLRPKLALADLSVINPASNEEIFIIRAVEIEVGLLSSLRDWRLAFRQLSFLGLQATLTQKEDGRWHVLGLPESPVPLADPPPSGITIDDPLDIFLFGRRVDLRETQLTFQFRNQLEANLTIPRIYMENDVDFHRLNAKMSVNADTEAMSLVVEGVGDPRDEDTFDASGYLKLRGFPSAQVLAALGVSADVLVKDAEVAVLSFADQPPLDPASYSPLTVDQQWQSDGRVDLDLWFDGTGKKGFSWAGEVAVDGVPLIPPAEVEWPTSFTSAVSGRWDPQAGWRMSFGDADLRWLGFAAPIANMQFTGGRGDASELRIEQLDVSQWHSALHRAGWLPAPLKRIFSELKPYGMLTAVTLQMRPPEEGYFLLRARVDSGGVHPWAGVPAVDGIDGFIETSAVSGHVMLNNQQGFTLNFPKVYRAPLEFSRAQGNLRWKVDLDAGRVGISSGLLQVATRDDVAANGYFNLRLPFHPESGREPEMTLVIGIEKGFAHLHRMLVPYTVPEHLYNWLDHSIQDGVLRDGAFIYHGTLMADSEQHQVLQLSTRTENATIKFHPDWPELRRADGHLLLDDARFSVSQLEGEMQGIRITNGEVGLREVGDEREQAIAVKGQLDGQSEQALQLLKTSPVRRLMGEELAGWQVDGAIHGTIDALVPLSEKAERHARQNIQLRLADNTLYIPGLNLRIDKLNGDFRYSDQQGVQVNRWEGRLWGNDIAFSLETRAADTDDAHLYATFNGVVDMLPLKQWLDRPEMEFMQGSSAFAGRLRIPLGSSKTITADIESDLQGVAIALPEPLAKAAEVPAQLNVRLELGMGDGRQTYHVDLQHHSRMQILLERNDDTLSGTSIALGEVQPELIDGTININGRVAHADALQWYDTLTLYLELLAAQPEQIVTDQRFALSRDPFSVEDNTTVRARLRFAELDAGALVFRDTVVEAMQSPAAWLVNLAGPDLSGSVDFPLGDAPLKVRLNRLVLQQHTASLASWQIDNDEPSGMQAINPESLPAADVDLASWSIQDQDMGRLAFKLRPTQTGAMAYDLRARANGLRIGGREGQGAELIWLNTAEGQMTHFSGVATAGGIGAVLQAWGLDRALTSKSAEFDVSLQWDGAPDDVSLLSIAGLVVMNLQRGRFIRGAGAGENPLVKLVGLLNFDTLARRLRLDFSDLHPEGLGYEEISGELIFNRGRIEIASPLRVSMPASELQLVGNVDMLAETLNGRLVATLPLAGNLTFAAALSGGIPTAVTVFVFSKLFKRQMDLASSLRYRISGDWDDPEIKLEKIFERETESP